MAGVANTRLANPGRSTDSDGLYQILGDVVHTSRLDDTQFMALLGSAVPPVCRIWLIHRKYRHMDLQERSKAILRTESYAERATGEQLMQVIAKVDHQTPIEGARQLLGNLSVSTRLDIFCAYLKNDQQFGEDIEPPDPEIADASADPTVLEQLECPICRNTCLPRIYGCINGHIICNTCIAKLKERHNTGQRIQDTAYPCPTCREPKLGNARFLELENYLACLELKCIYSSRPNGCKEILTGVEMQTHVTTQCLSRPWTCGFCKEELQLDTVRDHLMIKHKDIFGCGFVAPYNGSSRPMTLPIPMCGEETEVCFAIYYEKNWEKTFVLYQIRLAPIEYFWCLCLIGPEVEAQEYYAEFSADVKYEMGYGYGLETLGKTWKTVPIVSVQNNLRSILENLSRKYKEHNQLPLLDLSYTNYDRDRRKRAHRVEARLRINIYRKPNVQDTGKGLH